MGVDACMVVRWKGHPTPEEVRRMSARLVEAFGTEPFAIERPGDPNGFHQPCGQHALTIVDGSYEQDGPDMTPLPDETLVEVNLFGRYYGIGYERGDLPTLLAIAGWLEANAGEVYYGGDSGGVCATPFNRAARDELFAHFCRVGHEPYAGRGFGDDHWQPEPCGFCLRPLVRYGSGGSWGAWACHGCGLDIETRDGVTYTPRKERS